MIGSDDDAFNALLGRCDTVMSIVRRGNFLAKAEAANELSRLNIEAMLYCSDQSRDIVREIDNVIASYRMSDIMMKNEIGEHTYTKLREMKPFSHPGGIEGGVDAREWASAQSIRPLAEKFINDSAVYSLEQIRLDLAKIYQVSHTRIDKVVFFSNRETTEKVVDNADCRIVVIDENFDREALYLKLGKILSQDAFLMGYTSYICGHEDDSFFGRYDRNDISSNGCLSILFDVCQGIIDCPLAADMLNYLDSEMGVDRYYARQTLEDAKRSNGFYQLTYRSPDKINKISPDKFFLYRELDNEDPRTNTATGKAFIAFAGEESGKMKIFEREYEAAAFVLIGVLNDRSQREDTREVDKLVIHHLTPLTYSSHSDVMQALASSVRTH